MFGLLSGHWLHVVVKCCIPAALITKISYSQRSVYSLVCTCFMCPVCLFLCILSVWVTAPGYQVGFPPGVPPLLLSWKMPRKKSSRVSVSDGAVSNLYFMCFIKSELKQFLYPSPIIFSVCRSCEAAFLQAAHSDIERQLPVDLSFLHSAAAVSSPVCPTAPNPAHHSFGFVAWLWRWCRPLGSQPGFSLQQRTGVRSRPAGLWQEQPSPVQHWPQGGRGSVCGSPGGVEGEGGASGDGAAGTQPRRIPVCGLHTEIPTQVLFVCLCACMCLRVCGWEDTVPGGFLV